MAKHIYLESSFKGETYLCEMNMLRGSYFEKIGNNYDKAIITAVSLDLINNQNGWCVEIVESKSYPLIKYYHFKNLSDLVDIYQANEYNFITPFYIVNA
jgi:hypothetical protein